MITFAPAKNVRIVMSDGGLDFDTVVRQPCHYAVHATQSSGWVEEIIYTLHVWAFDDLTDVRTDHYFRNLQDVDIDHLPDGRVTIRLRKQSAQ